MPSLFRQLQEALDQEKKMELVISLNQKTKNNIIVNNIKTINNTNNNSKIKLRNLKK